MFHKNNKKNILRKKTFVFISMTLYKKVKDKNPSMLQTHINFLYQALHTSQLNKM